MIPLALRFNAIPFLSVGGGAYFLHKIGTASTDTSVTAPAGIPTTTTTSSPDPQNGFGLQASARFGFPIAPMISMFADARYLIGLTNWDNTGAGNTQRFNHLMFLAGVGFEL